jgi:hypothetical protein
MPDPTEIPDPKAALEGAPPSPAAPSPEGENLGSKPGEEGGEGGLVDPPSPPQGAEPPKQEGKSAAQPAWKAEKYDKVLAQKKDLEEKLAAAIAAQDPNAPKLTEADIQARASEIAAQTEFNRRANAVAEAGKSQFPDFLDKMAKIREQVDPNDLAEQNRFVQMVAATMEAGDAAARILYELGSNPDLATEVMKLSPVQQGMRIAKMAEKKGDPEPSGAPKPPSVLVGGRGSSQEEIDPADPVRADKLSSRTWIERRQKDIEEKKKQGVRIW